jgi:hypothetical protein
MRQFQWNRFEDFDLRSAVGVAIKNLVKIGRALKSGP